MSSNARPLGERGTLFLPLFFELAAYWQDYGVTTLHMGNGWVTL